MKTTLYLHKMDETTDSTVSSLFALDPNDDSIRRDFLGFIIEDGFRKIKVPGETRIPAGLYKLRKKTDGHFFDIYSNKWNHKWVAEVMDVPGFKDVLIHIGNFIHNTRACLLPNRSVHYDKSKDAFYGEDSSSMYKHLYDYLDPLWGDDDEVWIDVKR